jgi:6-pyruvoyltetrahydropterin/6-carboxytetrahydropterin synthase
MWELTKSFGFEAAHALSGTTLGAISEEIHGHSFRAEITIRGVPDPDTGMVVDLGLLDRNNAALPAIHDHKNLNKIHGLERPTLENLARFIWQRVETGGQLVRVTVRRDSCHEACSYFGPQQNQG